MNKKIRRIGLLMIASVLLLSGCGKTPAYVGTYKNGEMYIELKANGKFIAENYIKLTGKYRVNQNEVEFNIENLNDKKFNRKVMGNLKGNRLTGPDRIEYTK